MTIGEPWGLLALAGLAAVLAIHLLRRRFRPLAVTALWLFGPAAPPAGAGRTRKRILNRASLWCELAAVAAAAWYLADLHADRRRPALHLGVVLDASWRLQARSDDGTTAQERLRTALAARLAALDRDDRVSLVVSGPTPHLIAGPSATVAEARAALAAWRADAPAHDLAPALALAGEITGGPDEAGERRSGLVLLAGDALPPDLPDLPDGTGLLLTGQALATSGLADLRRLPADGRRAQRLLARVVACGGAPRTRDLEVLDAAGRPLLRSTLALAPGRPALADLDVPPAALDQILTVRLAGDDPLVIDDAGTVPPPPNRSVRVHLDPALPGRDDLRRAVLATGRCVEAAGAATAPLHILGAAPATGAPLLTLRLLPGGGAPTVGPFLRRAGHPLLRDLDFTGAVWKGGVPLASVAAGEVLLSAGDQALAAETAQGVVLHLDPAGLLRHPSWPALWANVVELAAERLPGVSTTALPVGRPLTVVLPAGAGEAELVAPAGGTHPLRPDSQGRAVIPALSEAGPHRLRLAGRDWQTVVALPCDERLTDCTACQSGSREPAPAAGAAIDRGRGPLAHLLPILLMALFALAAWRAFRHEEGR